MQHDTLLLPFIIVNYDGDLIIKRNWISLTTTSACVRAVDDLDLLGVMPTTSPLMMLSTTVQKKKERAEIDISFFFFFPLFKKSILQPPTSSFPFWKRILLFFFFVDFSKKKFCSIELSLITHLRRRSTAFVLGWGPRCGPRELCHRWRSSPGIVANRNDRLIDSPKPAFFNRFKINMIMMK